MSVKILSKNKYSYLFFALTVILIITSSTTHAKSNHALGARAGFSSGPDQFVFGLQGNFGAVGEIAGSALFTPSADIGLGNDLTSITINGDLRWYLARLPKTGIKFYGAAGPTLGYYSSKNSDNSSGNSSSSSTELGLSLTAGARIPMKAGRSYNVELRFGFGDIPDLKIMLGVMF